MTFQATERQIKQLLGDQFLTLSEANKLSRTPTQRAFKYRLYQDITETSLCRYLPNGTGLITVFTASSAAQKAKFNEVIAYIQGLTA